LSVVASNLDSSLSQANSFFSRTRPISWQAATQHPEENAEMEHLLGEQTKQLSAIYVFYSQTSSSGNSTPGTPNPRNPTPQLALVDILRLAFDFKLVPGLLAKTAMLQLVMEVTGTNQTRGTSRGVTVLSLPLEPNDPLR
jgi:hypothetical protein